MGNSSPDSEDGTTAIAKPTGDASEDTTDDGAEPRGTRGEASNKSVLSPLKAGPIEASLSNGQVLSLVFRGNCRFVFIKTVPVVPSAACIMGDMTCKYRHNILFAVEHIHLTLTFVYLAGTPLNITMTNFERERTATTITTARRGPSIAAPPNDELLGRPGRCCK